jgi:peptidyl-prolyl cis-trans isomerase C
LVATISTVLLLAPSHSAAQGDGARVVARIGDAAIVVSDVHARMKLVPLFQLRAMGNSEDQIRKTFVQRLLLMELVAIGARAEGLHERYDIRERIQNELKKALLETLSAEAARRSVTDGEVKAYYDRNIARYRSEKRLKLWRIVVRMRSEAAKLLETISTDADYKKDPLKGWEKLARAHSLDKGTSMRRGNIGFVQPDGSTAHKDVRVSPELYQAASRVKDGEMVPVPVADGEFWVVVQRRGSHDTPERTLQLEGPTIRRILAKQGVIDTITKLLEKLRAKDVGSVQEKLVDQLQITFDGDLTPTQRPGSLPVKRHGAAGPSRPGPMLR